MNNFDIENKTKEIFNQLETESPSEDFTQKVMKRVEKEKSYKPGFDLLQNFLIGLAAVVGVIIFNYYKTGSFLPGNLLKEIDLSVYLKVFYDFAEHALSGIEFSPFLIFSIIAITVLMMSDQIMLRLINLIKS
jgi:hypothetical protein